MGTVGNFEIQAELERGVGYTSYSALHRQLGQPVVVKVLTGGSQAQPDVRQRFVNEASLLTKLDHPCIQRVVEAGDEGGQPYVAMVPTQAQRIGALLQQRPAPLPVATATQIVCRLAEALEHAHAKGVVHRDISLTSVLLGADGVPLLTDFGFTRDVDPTAPGVAQTGRCMGTPGYSSPEQASGQISKISPISDVYMLGAVFYTLLVRQTPIQGNSPMGIMARTMSQEPLAPRSLRPDVPASVEQVVLRCLAKAPEQRYASAGDLKRALEAILVAMSGESATVPVKLSVPSGSPAPPPQDMFGDGDGGAAPTTASGRRRSVSGRNRRGRKNEEGGKLSRRKGKQAGLPLVPILAVVGVLGLGVVGFLLSGSESTPPEDIVADDPVDTPAETPAEDSESLLSAGIESLGKADYTRAISSLDKALEIDPELAPAYNTRGNAHYSNGNFEAAYADFSKAVKLRPNVAEGYHNLGSAAESLGKTEEAIRAYDRFLELEPYHSAAEGVREDLERLKAKLEKSGGG